ncbi:MAG: EamA family transporter, partial [Flavobacteriaceae bacterium]
MSTGVKKWVYLIVLSIIWGSSYILIKKGLLGLQPLELGSLRIVFTFGILLLMGYKSLKTIPKEKWGWVALSGFLGTFFPNYLFAFAETKI